MTGYVYYVNGTSSVGPLNAILSSTESSGGSWSTPVPITIDGAVNQNAVDPNIIALSNGQFLLTYMFGNFGFPNASSVNTIYTAVSSDGINFTDAQPAFANTTGATLTDPTEVQLADGTFLAAVSNVGTGSSSLYHSTDGRTFTPTGVTLPSVFSSDLLLLPDGSVRIFYKGSSNMLGGIVSDISHDGGQTWTMESGIRLGGPYFDPSVVEIAPGQWEMVVKSFINPSSPTLGPSNQELSLATSTDGFDFTVTQPNFAVQASVGDIAAFLPVAVTGGGLLNSLSVDQQMELIYIGYFDRSADSGGFNFWEGQNVTAQSNGQSAAVALTNIANSFTPQAETIALYPFLSNTHPNYGDPTVQAGLNTFIENVYGNLFGHTADSGGLSYWTGQIESGAVGLGATVLAIANGAQRSDATILLNKIYVALDFTTQTGQANIPVTSNLLAEAKAILVGVDGVSLNDASVNNAEVSLIPWLATHPHGASVAVVGSALPDAHTGLL